MQIVPLNPVPSQTQQIVLDGQNVLLNVYTLYANAYFSGLGVLGTAGLYMDVTVGTSEENPTGAVANTRICLNETRVLLDCQYQGFEGDFAFVDTQGSDDPVYTGLGSRFVLVYLEAADIEAAA
jgi:hypothetical protein